MRGTNISGEQIAAAAAPLLVAKIVSAGLIIVGFGMFFIFELGA